MKVPLLVCRELTLAAKRSEGIDCFVHFIVVCNLGSAGGLVKTGLKYVKIRLVKYDLKLGMAPKTFDLEWNFPGVMT